MSRGKVYTLHFWPKLAHAGHYTGTTRRPLRERLTDHALGRGARITQVQVERGGYWVLGDEQPGGRVRERQLKNQHNGALHCGVCKALKGYERGQLSQDEALAKAGWNRSSQFERKLLLDIFGIEKTPELVPAPLPEPKPITQHFPEPVTEITPEMEAVVDELCAKWRAEADAAAAATPDPEQTPELSHTAPLEIPAPRPSSEPQTQADAAPEPQAQADIAPEPQAQADITAEPEVEIEL